MMELDKADNNHPSREAILDTLRIVIDPELGINIIDMGLVYSIVLVDELKQISIQMTLSTRHCPMGGTIVGAVENCMQYHYPKYKTIIDLVWEPQWTYKLISEEGRRLLNM